MDTRLIHNIYFIASIHIVIIMQKKKMCDSLTFKLSFKFLLTVHVQNVLTLLQWTQRVSEGVQFAIQISLCVKLNVVF